LIVYNIPNELTTSDLTDLFAECGTILSAIVKKPLVKKTQDATKSTFGFVLFTSPDAA
jgi:RNA recognition motif-containing protein